MPKKTIEPHSSADNDSELDVKASATIWHGLLRLLSLRQAKAREQIAEIIEKQMGTSEQIDIREQELINNILGVSNITVDDIMTPRAEIVGIDCSQKISVILDSIAQNHHSRYPLYHESLDNIIGTIHVKSVYAWLLKNDGKIKDDSKNFAVIMKKLIHVPSYIAPSMRVLDLLLYMRERRNHIAFVVDEYGGIDGLITIEDALEEIVGSIEDEYDTNSDNDDGISYGKDESVTVEGRFKLEDFENKFGKLLSKQERLEDWDTIGGLVVYLAGRVPTKGELIPWKIHPDETHSKAAKIMEFEIIRSLPNRVVRVKLHGLATKKLIQK